jgi:hypothetical protein
LVKSDVTEVHSVNTSMTYLLNFDCWELTCAFFSPDDFYNFSLVDKYLNRVHKEVGRRLLQTLETLGISENGDRKRTYTPTLGNGWIHGEKVKVIIDTKYSTKYHKNKKYEIRIVTRYNFGRLLEQALVTETYLGLVSTYWHH